MNTNFIFISAISLSLCACGGGGSSESNNNNASIIQQNQNSNTSNVKASNTNKNTSNQAYNLVKEKAPIQYAKGDCDETTFPVNNFSRYFGINDNGEIGYLDITNDNKKYRYVVSKSLSGNAGKGRCNDLINVSGKLKMKGMAEEPMIEFSPDKSIIITNVEEQINQSKLINFIANKKLIDIKELSGENEWVTAGLDKQTEKINYQLLKTQKKGTSVNSELCLFPEYNAFDLTKYCTSNQIVKNDIPGFPSGKVYKTSSSEQIYFVGESLSLDKNNKDLLLLSVKQMGVGNQMALYGKSNIDQKAPPMISNVKPTEEQTQTNNGVQVTIKTNKATNSFEDGYHLQPMIGFSELKLNTKNQSKVFDIQHVDLQKIPL